MLIIDDEIKSFFSDARLDKYEKIDIKNTSLTEKYLINKELSEKCLGAISLFEVFLRNSISKAILNKYHKFGLLHKSFFNSLKPAQQEELLTVLKSIDDSISCLEDAAKNPKVSSGLVISRLGLKFWINMFDVKGKILNDERYFKQIFPKFKLYNEKDRKIKVQEMYSQLERIRILRNRVCHHEIILYDETENVLKYMKLIVSYFENPRLDCFFYNAAGFYKINEIFEKIRESK